MYELWAKRITTQRYEHIQDFDDDKMFYTLKDNLDKNIYQEIIILENKELKLYLELNKEKVLKK